MCSIQLDHHIRDYFIRGYEYADILKLLKKNHNYCINIRTLHRRIRLKGLSRKHLVITSTILLQDVQKIISRSGYQNRGYRNVRQRLMQEGKQYSGNSIRLALQVLDPEGVEHRLKNIKKDRLKID